MAACKVSISTPVARPDGDDLLGLCSAASGWRKLPVVWYLSGLTCTHANVTEKGEFRGACAELGLVFVAPDTSPRGENVPGDPARAYDFGLGAGFYVDATKRRLRIITGCGAISRKSCPN